MSKFILFIRDEGADFSKYTAKEFEQLFARFGQWSQELSQKGKLVSGDKLKDDGGKTLKSVNGRLVTGGSYTSNASTVGGYYVIQAENYDEALSLVKSCPAIEYGGSIEVREIEIFE